jgi:hypothetical protein
MREKAQFTEYQKANKATTEEQYRQLIFGNPQDLGQQPIEPLPENPLPVVRTEEGDGGDVSEEEMELALKKDKIVLEITPEEEEYFQLRSDASYNLSEAERRIDQSQLVQAQ